MRKLKLQMQTSLDGFVSTGPNDEQRWVTWELDQIKSYILELLDTSDTILIGRKLATDYIPFWLDTVTKPDHEMHEIAQRIVAARKVVFTKTLERPEWPNTDLAKKELSTEVNALKNQKGKDIIVYGGSSFVSALVKAGLIDEFHFFVNPVVLGKGDSIFDQVDSLQQLKLIRSITYDSGIILLNYERK